MPILYCLSSENIEFVNNIINYNNDFQSWKQKAFKMNKVRNMTIGNNSVTPEKKFTIDDVNLENTDQSEIHID